MNFCAGCLEPSVSTNKPEADGREVCNLVSEDPSTRRKGYMGEYFIRPPADITVTFKVPIDISHIKLNTFLEQKCSTGFSIFTHPEETSQDEAQSNASRSGPEIVSNEKNASSSYAQLKPNSFAPSSNLPPVQDSQKIEDNGDVYYCVGTFFTQGEDCVILRNHHYKHWIRVRMPEDNVTSDGKKIYRGALKHANRTALRCIRKLIVRIVRTSGSIPPVLQALEIWGQPGIKTDKVLRKEIMSRWFGRTRFVETITVPRIYNSQCEEVMRKESETEASKEKDSTEVPEDFLDPLTCEVMTVPLLLPSGHSIDANTLDRFIAHEAVWGRPASDPFTGVPFKHGQMPAPNVPLKARIDRFLLLNADHPLVQSCGRTLSASGTQQINSLNGIINGCRENSISSGVKRKFDDTADSIEESCTTFKQDHVNCESDSKARTRDSSINKPGTSKTIDTHVPQSQLVSELPSEKHVKSDHLSYYQAFRQRRNQISKPPQSSLAQKPSSSRHGLVHMIGSALSYTRQKGSGAKTQNQRVLGKPNTVVQGDAKTENTSALDLASKNSPGCSCGEKSDLYSLQCSHLMCRKCLFQQSKAIVTCSVCQQECKRSEVSKYHKKSIFSMDYQ
ncbi:RING finger protein 37 [Macrobrachium rosenbergii]|uniref:RING finger protein 37 n=1 Tax=Macrobrachium rosenbergii TaxID=79674 RepID=UPI0034D5C33E